ncbi:uncharacterized protein LOC135641283 isoform X2 [Musa acuminata AAA Group]|uniref:uncharacterized protein LOC135641283 isoform X2 n=1 Tax=Musa acuminata AAA Group TaxID=214697 RepID=UPI0031E46489
METSLAALKRKMWAGPATSSGPSTALGRRDRDRDREKGDREKMLRVSEEEGNRKRESYVESYRQLGRSLLDLQRAADRVFDTISRRAGEERDKLTEISRRIQLAKFLGFGKRVIGRVVAVSCVVFEALSNPKFPSSCLDSHGSAQIDVLSRSEQALTIKSPSRYPSSSIQEEDFRPLFPYHGGDADEGSSVANLLVNGGLNREFGADGTLELFQFFSEQNIGYPLKETEAKGYPRQDMFLEKILEAPKDSDDSFLAFDIFTPVSKLDTKKDDLPPVPPSLLKNFTSPSDSAGVTLGSIDHPAKNI